MYHYSGTENAGNKWSEELLFLKSRVEEILDNKYKFNFALLNYYKDGSENIGMHSDDVRDLDGPIASVSLGAERFFDIVDKTTNEKTRTNLANGSMILMNLESQRTHTHGVPKQMRIKKARINITFRIVLNK